MKYGRTVLAVTAALAVLASTQAAGAHPAPFTVKAGSAPAGTAVAVTLTSGSFSWRDTTAGGTFNCGATTVHGSVTAGSRPARIGTLSGPSAAFTNCTGPAGLRFVITGYGTWTLDAVDSTSGVTKITVGNVRAHATTPSGPMCAWDFAAPSGSFVSSGTSTTSPGSLATTYTNSSRVLALPATNPGSLGLWNVKAGSSGNLTYCVSPAFFKQGDRIAWNTSWTLTADNSAYAPVSIT